MQMIFFYQKLSMDNSPMLNPRLPFPSWTPPLVSSQSTKSVFSIPYTDVLYLYVNVSWPNIISLVMKHLQYHGYRGSCMIKTYILVLDKKPRSGSSEDRKPRICVCELYIFSYFGAIFLICIRILMKLTSEIILSFMRGCIPYWKEGTNKYKELTL